MDNHKNGTSAENDEIQRIIREGLTDEFCLSFVQVAQDVWMPETYLKFAESIQSFEIRDSDIIVASYPKSGTTWTQEMVWLIANDLNFKGAEVKLSSRFPFLEFCSLYDHDKFEKALNPKCTGAGVTTIEYTKNQKSPRFIKTHLPFSLLPEQIQKGSKTPKIIYVTRNPKDTCVSYYHHGRLLRRWTATLEDFAKVFLADKAMYGSYWKHVFGYWKHKSSQNFLVLNFEDMKSDLPVVIKDVANFLGKEMKCEQVKQLCNHLSFEAMKGNEAVNHQERIETRKKLNLIKDNGTFMRSGKVGKYKEELSSQTIERFDAWIKENIEGTDFGSHYNYNV